MRPTTIDIIRTNYMTNDSCVTDNYKTSAIRNSDHYSSLPPPPPYSSLAATSLKDNKDKDYNNNEVCALYSSLIDSNVRINRHISFLINFQ